MVAIALCPLALDDLEFAPELDPQHPLCACVELDPQHPEDELALLQHCVPVAAVLGWARLANACGILGIEIAGSPESDQPYDAMNRPIVITTHAPAVIALCANERDRAPAMAPRPSISGTVPSAKHSMDAPPSSALPVPSA